jgi:hypothetical protein
MEKNPINKGSLTENSVGLGTVTQKMVRERAAELAVINGRAASAASPSELEQAKRELTGGLDIDPREAMFEDVPETKRWDPVPGSTGHKAPESPSEDEDEEGRSEGEQLVAEGVAEAEHDQMLQAARKAVKDDQDGRRKDGELP